jgi:hypothetical protein
MHGLDAYCIFTPRPGAGNKEAQVNIGEESSTEGMDLFTNIQKVYNVHCTVHYVEVTGVNTNFGHLRGEILLGSFYIPGACLDIVRTYLACLDINCFPGLSISGVRASIRQLKFSKNL